MKQKLIDVKDERVMIDLLNKFFVLVSVKQEIYPDGNLPPGEHFIFHE